MLDVQGKGEAGLKYIYSNLIEYYCINHYYTIITMYFTHTVY